MNEPRRPLGGATAVCLVVGSMVGSGVFTLPASLAAFGGLAMVGWVLSAGGSVLLALVFAHLARVHPAAGGPYAYTRERFGDLPGFLVAWGYWISVWSANATLAVSFVGYLDPFLPSLVRRPATAAAMALATVWLVTGINCLGIAAAGRVQVVTTTLKVLPLLGIGLAGLWHLEPAHFEVPAALAQPGATGPALLAVVTLTMFAFMGLESATIPAGAVRAPERTIPRATLLGTLLAAALYMVATAGAMSLVPPDELARSSAPFADAARRLGGDTFAGVVAAGAAVASFGALNGWVLVVGQLPLAVARDGLFPAPFARVNGRAVPVTGMLIAGVASSVLIACSYSGREGTVALYTKLLLLSTLSALIPYACCALAVFWPGGRRAMPLGRGMQLLAGLAFVCALFAIVGAGVEVVATGSLLLVAGLPAFWWVRRSRGSPAG